MATIYVMAGEYDKAIDELDYLLSIPSWFSVNQLKLDPFYDPLRNHPGYQELIRKYGSKYST
ncbi:MAG: hypothetical protein GWN14_20330 [candidate division Zixibacteria bacterium]|nr:hypothetical protein [candidate division Zixibacteria bacterium]NIW40029.1 hypothetical protein [candidate division Zixibacteria bacterium]NIX58196.1 hypothetical protein [candidate division Zixibacteria bacterium]